MARELAQHMQSWLPTTAAPNPSSQQRVLDLEAEIAKLKAAPGEDESTPASGPTPSASTPSAPIVQSLRGRPQSSSTFEPSSLLVMPGSTNSWLTSNPIPTLTEAAYKQWLKDLQLPQPKLDTLNRNLTKALGWWQNQHDNAGATISRVIVAMEWYDEVMDAFTAYLQ